MATKTKKAATYKCRKCGKTKKRSEGYFVLGGSTFCCNVCCKKGKKKENVCEFC